ncbi:MAG TPA: hypothetical protein VMY42_20180 [Thermoguttaceae bacterium]|nr:hypothetical protein [Thermoguttaceae bacterium]
MEISRNQYFMVGLVLVLLGLQFRLVDLVTLTPDFTQLLAKQTNPPVAAVNTTTQAMLQTPEPVFKKSFRPPEWLGWCFLSIGSVLVLHSLAMSRPE